MGRGPSRPFVDNPVKLNLLGPALPVTFGAAAFAVAVAGLRDAHFSIAIRAVVTHAATPRFQYRLLWPCRTQPWPQRKPPSPSIGPPRQPTYKSKPDPAQGN